MIRHVFKTPVLMQKNEERTNFENLEIVLLVIVVAIQQLSVGLETY